MPQRIISDISRGAVGPTQRQQDDRLEQGRLAGGVWTPDELRPGPELEIERRVAPEIPDYQGSEQRRRPGGCGNGTRVGDLWLLTKSS